MSDRFENRADSGGYNYAPETADNAFLSQYALDSKVKLQVWPQVLLYRKQESGWSIYIVETDDRDRRFKVSGSFVVALSIGQCYLMEGKVTEYNGERQLSVTSYQVTEPDDKESVIAVLRTIEELNTSAHEVYEKYGPSILKDIISDPVQVAQALGYPVQSVEQWRLTLTQNEAYEEAFTWLKEYGLSDKQAKQLLDQFGPEVKVKIEENPYFLIDHFDSFTFKNCDKYALQNGYPFNGTDRLMHGMLSVLKSAAYQEGHCYLPDYIFNERLHALLDCYLNFREASSLYKSGQDGTMYFTKNGIKDSIEKEDLRKALDDWESSDKKTSFHLPFRQVDQDALSAAMKMLLSSNRVVQKKMEDGSIIFMLGYYAKAEEQVTQSVRAMVQSEYGAFSDNAAVLDKVCEKQGIKLEKKQKEAALRFTEAKGGIFILNGAAGCGKTFVLKIILATLRALYKEDNTEYTAQILAPTGKAAQVAHNATGVTAYTIHRALGFVQTKDNQEGQQVTIHPSVLIIDEFSMVDIMLAASLFERIGAGTKVIILGDTEQLPSIGPGSVLKDLIESGVIPTVTLDVVKRQGAGSGILENANRILAGQPLVQITHGGSGDAYIFETEDVLEIRRYIRQIYKQWTGKLGLSKVQVLCPQKNTLIGTYAMNYLLQQTVNPDKDGEPKILARTVSCVNKKQGEIEVDLCFKAGDRVIHTQNDYDMTWYKIDPVLGWSVNLKKKGIINGEIGTVIMVSDENEAEQKTKKQRVYVQYDEGIVVYENDFSHIEHAYAITIHKAQGSQWPVVIAPVSTKNYIMLNRKLLYTLYTRAQNLNFTIGERKAMDFAIKNTQSTARLTTLSSLLKATLPDWLENGSETVPNRC